MATWAEATADDLLYALARDNEAEFIADELEHRPEILMGLAARGATSVEVDAKWQIAAKLGELNGQKLPEAEVFLTQLVQDADEYVSRRALLALGKLKSETTEIFAERAWQTGLEYQRIAALWALKEVASPKLSSYLLEAEKDGREYVVRNAEEIRTA